MTTAELERAREEVRQRLRDDTPFWAEEFGYIIDKNSQKVPLLPKQGQIELDRQLEAQRAAGKPMRAIILKARQVGFSTWVQAKLIQRATQRPHYHCAVVAHDRETGGKLYRMGETLYGNLPDDEELGLKPEIASHRRARFLHFANGAKESWIRGELWPDSTYLVDTANEFQAGRGGTYQAVHCSEVAFWERIDEKLTALRQSVPRRPDTMFILESTANGFNAFKDEWDRAADDPNSDYIAFFWPWWKEEEYRQPFMNEAERARFVVGELPYGEEEPKLIERFDLDLEQLNWRRMTITNECGGRIETFHQEYPSSAEEAFLSTGRKVFDPFLVKGVLFDCEAKWDPVRPTTERRGPLLGRFEAKTTVTRQARSGTVSIPTETIWVPRRQGDVGEVKWRLWLPEGVDAEKYKEWVEGRQFVIGVDVSGGQEEETDEPDWHAIEVIDHKEKVQVAEYRSRIDPDLLSEQVFMAAQFFNRAWVAVERTGSWGLPILRALADDFRYMPFLYRSKRKDTPNEKREHRLGWETSRRSKPIMEAGMIELLREGNHGIKSRMLAKEMSTYVRNEKGQTGAEPGKYDDLLIAYEIAQQVSRELPVKAQRGEGSGVHHAQQAAVRWPR